MTKRYLALDLETARVSDGSGDWRSQRPLGITCVALLGTGDGALGFWAALDEVYPETREQRCWVHKVANVLNYLPKAVQPKAKLAVTSRRSPVSPILPIRCLTNSA